MMAVPCLAQDTVEITETDITKIEDHASIHTTVFGIHLGMEQEVVESLLAAAPLSTGKETSCTQPRIFESTFTNERSLGIEARLSSTSSGLSVRRN